jgi:hypothetical protein
VLSCHPAENIFGIVGFSAEVLFIRKGNGAVHDIAENKFLHKISTLTCMCRIRLCAVFDYLESRFDFAHH